MEFAIFDQSGVVINVIVAELEFVEKYYPGTHMRYDHLPHNQRPGREWTRAADGTVKDSRPTGPAAQFSVPPDAPPPPGRNR